MLESLVKSLFCNPKEVSQQKSSKDFQEPISQLKKDLEEAQITLSDAEYGKVRKLLELQDVALAYNSKEDQKKAANNDVNNDHLLISNLSMVLKSLKSKNILDSCQTKVFEHLEHIERIAKIFSKLELYQGKEWLNEKNISQLYKKLDLLTNIEEVINKLVEKEKVTNLNIRAAFSFPVEFMCAIQDQEKAVTQCAANHSSLAVNNSGAQNSQNQFWSSSKAKIDASKSISLSVQPG